MNRIFTLILLVSLCMGLYGVSTKEYEQHKTFKEQMMQKDKLLHYSACFVLTTGGYMFGQSNGYNTNESKAIGVGLALGIGIAKEYYDTIKKKPTGWSWHDLLADIAGITSAVSLIGVSNELQY